MLKKNTKNIITGSPHFICHAGFQLFFYGTIIVLMFRIECICKGIDLSCLIQTALMLIDDYSAVTPSKITKLM